MSRWFIFAFWLRRRFCPNEVSVMAQQDLLSYILLTWFLNQNVIRTYCHQRESSVKCRLLVWFKFSSMNVSFKPMIDGLSWAVCSKLKFSFWNRVFDQWNSLPEDIINTNNMNSFKNRIDNHIKTKLGESWAYSSSQSVLMMVNPSSNR